MNAVPQPLVLPVRPALGWRRAGAAQRALALCVVPLIALWTFLLARVPGAGDVVTAVTALTVGPPAFWSLARVLRPHVDVALERVLRHALAAASTCFGTVVIVGIAVNTRDGDYLGLFAGLASIGLVVTLPWAVVAVVVRAVTVPRPAAPTRVHGGPLGHTVLPR